MSYKSAIWQHISLLIFVFMVTLSVRTLNEILYESSSVSALEILGCILFTLATT